MLNNRRQFIQTAGMVAGAAVLSGLPLMASEPMVNVAERKVSTVISQYGRCVRISRNTGQATEFKVKVRSPAHFAKVFDPQSLPFERIHVGPGNTLKFKHHGAQFTIIHVG